MVVYGFLVNFKTISSRKCGVIDKCLQSKSIISTEPVNNYSQYRSDIQETDDAKLSYRFWKFGVQYIHPKAIIPLKYLT